MINGKETNNGNDAKNASAASSASKRKKSTTQNDATVRTLGEAPLELHLWSWEVVRYKYKFYAADEVINATYTKWITINFLYTYFVCPSFQSENDNLNRFVLCFLKGRRRRLCLIRVSPPEVSSKASVLDIVVAFHALVIQAFIVIPTKLCSSKRI